MAGNSKQKKSSFISIFNIFRACCSPGRDDTWDEAGNCRGKICPSDEATDGWFAEPGIDRKASDFIAKFYATQVNLSSSFLEGLDKVLMRHNFDHGESRRGSCVACRASTLKTRFFIMVKEPNAYGLQLMACLNKADTVEQALYQGGKDVVQEQDSPDASFINSMGSHFCTYHLCLSL